MKKLDAQTPTLTDSNLSLEVTESNFVTCGKSQTKLMNRAGRFSVIAKVQFATSVVKCQIEQPQYKIADRE